MQVAEAWDESDEARDFRRMTREENMRKARELISSDNPAKFYVGKERIGRCVIGATRSRCACSTSTCVVQSLVSFTYHIYLYMRENVCGSSED